MPRPAKTNGLTVNAANTKTGDRELGNAKPLRQRTPVQKLHTRMHLLQPLLATANHSFLIGRDGDDITICAF